MAATVHLFLDTAGSNDTPGAETDIDAAGPPELRFKDADDATIDSADPIPIPAAGTFRSRWKQIYIEVTAGSGFTIDNVRFFTDGTNNFGTGVDVDIGDEHPVKNSGANTGYEVADVSDEVMTNHADITGVTDVFALSSGSPRTVTISEAGAVINASGEACNYVVLQMKVASTASPGELPVDEQMTFRYDEV